MKKEKRGRRSPCGSRLLEYASIEVSGPDEDFGGTRFKGYTIVVSDVNRRQLVGFGRQKMVGPRQTL